jgi:hypothetical protein
VDCSHGKPLFVLRLRIRVTARQHLTRSFFSCQNGVLAREEVRLGEAISAGAILLRGVVGGSEYVAAPQFQFGGAASSIYSHDRYFIIPFAYENKGNDPAFSHSFMSVIRVLADDKQAKLTPGLQMRTYKNREFEAFTMSWLPHDFSTNPHLCVFEGVGSRIFPKRNVCPLSVAPMTVFTETIESPSIASMPWWVCTRFTPTVESSARDSKCGESMARQES